MEKVFGTLVFIYINIIIFIVEGSRLKISNLERAKRRQTIKHFMTIILIEESGGNIQKCFELRLT